MGEYHHDHALPFDEKQQNLIDLQEAMIGVEHEQKVQIRIQAESIFKAMHAISRAPLMRNTNIP